MKIAFVYIGSENLGVEYLSSCLKRDGHDVKLFYDPSLFDDKFIFNIPTLSRIFDIKNSLIKSIVEYQPDLLAFSVFTDAYRWSIQMVEKIREIYEVPVIFGGVHPTAVPEVVIREKYIDMVNVGEGFESICELVNLMAARKKYYNVKNIWFKEKGRIIKNEIRLIFKNLDKLPSPDKEIFRMYFNISDNYLIMSSFGCPYRCTYCSNDLFLKLYKGRGSFMRRRSPENVIEELKIAKKKYGIKVVNFMDDIFTTDRKWLGKFIPIYKKEINLPYRAISHPKFIDEEIIKSLKNSGCYRIEFGIQTVNESVRKNVIKRVESNAEIEKTLKICEKYKLDYMLDHIFGIPGEDERQQLEAAKFYSNFKPARIANFWLVYYPGTEIINTAVNMKLLTEKDIQKLENGFIKNYHAGGSVENEQLIKLFKNFAVFFLLIPLLPKKINMKLAGSILLFKLHLIPSPVQTLLDLIGGLTYKDYDTITFAKYYLKFAIRILIIKFFRLRYIKIKN